jgi:uncharacterized protein (TIGR02118 family)
MLALTALYPHPTDIAKFDEDYKSHLKMLNDKTGIQPESNSYSVTKFLPGPGGEPEFYQMFRLTFDTPEAMNEVMSSEGMQEVAGDAHRISSGGAPIIMVGEVK